MILHSRAYPKSDGKRNNTVCSYSDETNEVKFAQIEKFIEGEEQMVVVKDLKRSSRSLLSCAGNPCRDSLKMYKEVDLLSRIIHVVERETGTIKVIKLADIKGKGVLIKTVDRTFAIHQPNSFERH